MSKRYIDGIIQGSSSEAAPSGSSEEYLGNQEMDSDRGVPYALGV